MFSVLTSVKQSKLLFPSKKNLICYHQVVQMTKLYIYCIVMSFNHLELQFTVPIINTI